MPRALLCLWIVAAFSLQSVDAGTSGVSAPVSASVIDVLQTHGVVVEPEPSRVLVELIRLLYGGSENRAAVSDALRREAISADSSEAGPAFHLTVPLRHEVWNRAIFKRAIPADRLVVSILADRRAALLLHGLLGLDDDTLAYLEAHPTVLSQLYERGTAPFAAFAGSLRVVDGRVVPPGAPDAVGLWEAAVGAPISDPARFITLLFSSREGREGRVAYLYDTVAQLDQPRAAFALGAGLAGGVRAARFQALVAAALREYGDWKLDVRPFSRPAHDLGLLFLRLRVDATGRLAPPADRPFWSAVFDAARDGVDPDDAAQPGDTALGNPPDHTGPMVDAAWLARAMSGGSMYLRGDRIDQLAFAQRVFGSMAEGERQTAVEVVRALPKYRMLLLTLERMGVRAPETFALALRQATRLDLGDGNRSFWQLAQIQSALALIARIHEFGTIDQATALRMLNALFALTPDESRHMGQAVAGWLVAEILPSMPPGADAETRLLLGLAGRATMATTAPRLEWEGQTYRVDVTRAEAERLRAVRVKQGGYTVDLALALDEVTRALALGGAAIEDVSVAHASLVALRDRFSATLDRVVDVLAPGVESNKPARDAIQRAVADLWTASRSRDPRRVSRAVDLLRDLIEVVLGEALLTLNYASALGSPDGAALLARNVALRHDFGFSRSGDDRIRVAWSTPRQDFQPGVPWHVSGSALGLHVALARLALRRVSTFRQVHAPKLSSLDRDAFAIGLALMRTRDLRDRDRDAIKAAIERGEARLVAMAVGTGGESFDAIADHLRLDGWRRRVVRHALADDPQQALTLFTLTERLVLGQPPADTALDAWGGSGLQIAGCLCTTLLLPERWHVLSGRPQLALGAPSVPDLNLRVAMLLSELGVPAALTRTVLEAALEEFLAEVTPNDAFDWWTLARTAARVSRERIEDYVAAATAVDGALVPEAEPHPRVP